MDKLGWSVAIIIEVEDHGLLCVKRMFKKEHLWSLPGGAGGAGEDVQRCAQRHVKELLALDLKRREFVPVTTLRRSSWDTHILSVRFARGRVAAFRPRRRDVYTRIVPHAHLPGLRTQFLNHHHQVLEACDRWPKAQRAIAA